METELYAKHLRLGVMFKETIRRPPHLPPAALALSVRIEHLHMFNYSVKQLHKRVGKIADSRTTESFNKL